MQPDYTESPAVLRIVAIRAVEQLMLQATLALREQVDTLCFHLNEAIRLDPSSAADEDIAPLAVSEIMHYRDGREDVPKSQRFSFSLTLHGEVVTSFEVIPVGSRPGVPVPGSFFCMLRGGGAPDRLAYEEHTWTPICEGTRAGGPLDEYLLERLERAVVPMMMDYDLRNPSQG